MLSRDDLGVAQEVNGYKDKICESALKIIDYLSQHKTHEIRKELVKMLTSWGQIGTLSDNPKAFNDYAQSFSHAFELGLNAKDEMQAQLLTILLNQISSTSFLIKKKGSKIVVKFPKIDSIFRIG